MSNSFFKSYALKLNWEDTTPVLSLLPVEYSIDSDSREGGGCSEQSEKEPLTIEPSRGEEISKDDHNESSSWEGEKKVRLSGEIADSKIGFENVSCSAKELPDGCGIENSTYFYKYGVDTGREEDNPNRWRYARENRVKILSTSPVVALRDER